MTTEARAHSVPWRRVGPLLRACTVCGPVPEYPVIPLLCPHGQGYPVGGRVPPEYPLLEPGTIVRLPVGGMEALYKVVWTDLAEGMARLEPAQWCTCGHGPDGDCVRPFMLTGAGTRGGPCLYVPGCCRYDEERG